MSRSGPPQSPVKLFYRTGEVARMVGVEPHVLRFWEGAFPSLRPQKSRTGRRFYTRRDVEKLLEIKELLYTERYTIAGARRRLRQKGGEPSASEDPARVAETELRQALLDVRQQVIALLGELGQADDRGCEPRRSCLAGTLPACGDHGDRPGRF